MLCTRCRSLTTLSPTLYTRPQHPTRCATAAPSSSRAHSTQTNSQTNQLTDSLARPEFKREWRTPPLLSIPIVCFTLGVWQIKRRKEKLQFVADIESRQNLEPVPFNSSTEYLEYTPVKIKGVYDYSHEFYLGPRHAVIKYRDMGEAGGYHSIVPMTLESGERILVDRGWVRDRRKVAADMMEGPVSQAGYIRYAEPPVMAILAPTPGSSNTYIWRDTGVMADIAGTMQVTVELLQQYTRDWEEGPLAGQTRLSIYNKHLEYIITWFGCGIASLFFVFRYKRAPRVLPKVFK